MKKFKILPSKIKSGLYHHKAEGEFQGLRLHLRVEKDGSGILIVNASRMLFLNRTATEHVHLFMHGKTDEEAAKEMQRKFKVDRETALKDHHDVLLVINTFAKTPDIDPISYLGVEKMEPFEKELSAPYRMDLAITYRCDINCYVKKPSETVELRSEEWFKIMDKLYSIGIPHVIFVGGEPTLRDDLPSLIGYTQKIGFVSGLVTNGRKLKDAAYLDQLIKAGLDHITITIESHDEKIHDKISGVEGSWRETIQGLRNALATPIYTITNTTLNQYNLKDILKTISFLHDQGLKQFECKSLNYNDELPATLKELALDEKKLEPVLTEIRNYAESLGMDFVWNNPQSCELINPSKLKQEITNCQTCRISMCIEPDGTVLPFQGYFKSLGNILNDSWKKIWNNPLCVKLLSESPTNPKYKTT